VDVFNFPQRRVNNTYQLADTLTWRIRSHGLMFGLDIRRSELNSDLPRNARPQVTFNGSPRLRAANGALVSPTDGGPNAVLRPEDLAAIGAASGFYISLLAREQDDSHLNLRFYQHNFFIQDEWRIRPNLSLSAGLRYEYNTPPRDAMRRIERTFNDQQALSLLRCPRSMPENECGLRKFIAGRNRIFDPDHNNFAPRFGLAFSPDFFGRNRATVIRAGYGVFYDQIIGAVVSQSRNVYPTFLTLNFSGLNAAQFPKILTFINPAMVNRFPICRGGSGPLVKLGTVNLLNPEICLDSLVKNVGDAFPSSIGLTLPTRRLETPSAHHWGITFEQQLGAQFVVSAGYVGTLGRRLLRLTTPNLGPGSTLLPISFLEFSNKTDEGESRNEPMLMGQITSPRRGTAGVGSVNLYETTAHSRYNALQLQARGRLRRSIQYQVVYNLSWARDDVSDIFDLAGAFALPQNSEFYSRSEYGPANFDSRHRVVFSFVHDLTGVLDSRGWGWLVDGLQLTGTGQFQTGQPFTVNSIFDINQDGNLTDRLNTAAGILKTGDRSQPFGLTAGINPFSLLAPFGQDGAVGRNTFRAGNLLSLDMAVIKQFRFSTARRIDLRIEFFNLVNRANFGIPARLLDVPWFGRATQTVTPGRRIQLSLKLVF
jgi:hypothetical protein